MRAAPAMLLGLCLLLLLGPSEAMNKHKQKHHPKYRHTAYKRSSQQQMVAGLLVPLSPNRDYCFEYKAQIASGYASSVSDQQAVSRLESKVCISVHSHDQAILRMDKIRFGQLNQELSAEEQCTPRLPFKAFQQQQKPTAQMKQQLQLPVEFAYIDGTVERLQFHEQDQPWSKNIKKAVLNLIQLNLKDADSQEEQQQQQYGEEEQQEISSINNNANNDNDNDYPVDSAQDQDDGQFTKMFTTTEMSVEGECRTTYTILSMPSQGQVNVTKTIDFNRCEKLADIAYGFQVEPIAYAPLPSPHDSTAQEQQPEKQTGRVIPQQKLDRSTIIRYVLSKKTNNQPDNNDNSNNDNGYAIRRVELLSQYTFKSSEAESKQAMQTVATAQLTFTESKSSSQNTDIVRNSGQNQEESLVYNADAESQEKEFYMFGDNNFQSPPFVRQPSETIERAESHLRKIVKSFEKQQQQQQEEGQQQQQHKKKEQKRKSSEEADTTSFATLDHSNIEHFEKLVTIIRKCSMPELKQLEQKADRMVSSGNQQENVGRDLFMDALAVAATRNTIELLAEKIQKQVGQQISEIKATQLLKVLGRGAGLPAPSDAQVDAIVKLCKSEVVQRSKTVLKQTCWLTFATMVGELSLQSRKAKLMHDTSAPMRIKEQAARHKIRLYKEILVEHYHSSADLYEKMLALKCIGNAGLKSTLPDLKSIINDHTELAIVRINAMDALRRLRFHLPPHTIQALVLPIYTNTQEPSEVRIAAFSCLMHMRPTQPIIDQIAFTMAKDKCRDVKGFVYSVIKAASQSPIAEQRQIADKCRNAMKVAQVEEEELESKQVLVSSRRLTTAFYSEEQQEGVFVSLQSIFSRGIDSQLPTHMSLGMDTFFNGQYNRNAFKLLICQKDMDDVAKQLFDISNDEEQEQQEGKAKPGFLSHAAQQLRSIFGKLSIKGRDKQQPEQQRGGKKEQPYLVLTVRLNDVDVGMIPLNMDNQQGSISRMKSMVRDALRRIFSRSQQQQWRLNGALVLNSRKASLPTSVGWGLRLSQSMYVIGQLSTNLQAQQTDHIKANIHPNLKWVQTQKMEAQAMVYRSGVQSSRSVAINLPLEVSYSESQKKQAKVSVKVPQQTTRLATLHSLPTTFTKHSNINATSNQAHYHRVKTVHSQKLQQQAREVDITVGEKSLLALPIRIHGHFHQPQEKSLNELLKVIMSGDNHVSIDLQPNGHTPREIQLKLNAEVFQPTSNSPATSIRPRLQDFYSKNQREQQQQEEWSSEEEDDRQPMGRNTEQREKQKKHFNTYLEKFANTQKRNYKHLLMALLETHGGRKTNRAELKLESVCDSRLRACEALLQAKRSALSGEKEEWTMEAQVLTLYPDYVSDVQELATDSTPTQQQKFFCHMEAKWGQQQQQLQSIQLNIQGQPSARMLKHIAQQQQQQQQQQDTDGYQQQSRRCAPGQQCKKQKRQTPFLDEYQLVADYTLQPSTKHFFLRQIEALKANNFWNTRSKVLGRPNQQQLEAREQHALSRGQAQAQLNIDPVTGRYANLSIQTESQRVWIRPLELPMKMRPMTLVRSFSPSRSAHSSQQLVGSVWAQGGPHKAQCKVGMKTVDTFDGVAYKAPISKCYTVLAKDCSHKDKPRFAVLMKSLQTGGEEKKIKIITQRDVIVVEPQYENQLRVKVNQDTTYIVGNGQERPEDEKQMRQKGIEFETEGDRHTVIVDGGGVAVKFNGKTAKIQLSEQYKQMQCGLCGNYNDDEEDELRMSNDELATDVNTFHRSYALQEEGECEQDEHANFYQQQKDAFGLRTQAQQQKQTSPIQRTVTMDYNHKVCFSLKPVRQCPQGYYSAAEEDDEEGKELLKRNKVQFACLDRNSIEAKRLRSIVRRNQVADVGEYSASFVESVVIPEICVKY